MSNTELLSTRDVAEQLSLSTRQVARLVDAGKLEPATKAPGKRGAFLFEPHAVEAFQAAS